MLLKLLCTLCTLVSSSALDHHMPTVPTANGAVYIMVAIEDTVIHNLCNDFGPNITNQTCIDTLFEPSEKLNFMTITNQTMLLNPRIDDGICYIDAGLLCLSEIYELTISALNASDHSPMMDKSFIITVAGGGKGEVETMTVILTLVGSGVGCLLSSCCQRLFRECRGWASQMRQLS